MDNYSQYANLPAATPPPGVVSNLDNPPSRALQLFIGMGTCIAVTTVLLALRMYAKLVVTNKPGWEDCETHHLVIIQTLKAVVACLIGFTLFVAHNAVTFTMTGSHGALGTHEWDTTIGQHTEAYEQNTLVTIDLYAAAAFFIKLSVFLLYLRLFKPNTFTRWLNYGGIIACGLFYSASITGNCVLFIPTRGQPNNKSAWLLRASGDGHRILILAVVQSVFGTLSDIYLLVIPIQMIFQLHFPIERKIGVSAVFMIGILAIACSLANLVYRVKELATMDHTWSGVTLYLFCSAELSAGIICSCMPICASLLRGHKPKKFHCPTFRHIYSNLRSLSFRRPPILNRTHSLDNLQPHQCDSYLETRSTAYTQLDNDGGREELKTPV